jgi:biopolymer transport protein ExbB/TolQ
MSASQPGSIGRRRINPTLAALLVGLPLSAGVLALFRLTALHNTEAARYLTHPAQWIAVVFFCTALGALIHKLWQSRTEAEVCHLDLLPRWDGVPIPISEAPTLLAHLRKLPARVQDTVLGRRMKAILEFLCQRRAADDLDDHLRSLSDADIMAQESSYAFIRFITWAIPIVGFLGTVLGITSAIANVSPDTLQDTLGQVTGGLAEAFDSTALALGLTMLAMFLNFLVEKQEQGVLETVDHVIDRQLSHRFRREGQAEGPFAAIVHQQTNALLQAVEQLVMRQAELWARVLGEPERRVADLHARMQDGMTKAIQTALEGTVAVHARRLAEMEQRTTEGAGQLLQMLSNLSASVRETGKQQQESLMAVARSIAGQAEVLGKLQHDSENLVHLQAVLHQNLAALAGAGSFDATLHALTAAVHMLTARTAHGASPAQLTGPRLAA